MVCWESGVISAEYVYILQWTPFPDKFLPIPEWQLQDAEYQLKLNSWFYYEHAIRTNKGLLYPVDIANRIVDYWSKKRSFAKYKMVPAQPGDFPPLISRQNKQRKDD